MIQTFPVWAWIPLRSFRHNVQTDRGDKPPYQPIRHERWLTIVGRRHPPELDVSDLISPVRAIHPIRVTRQDPVATWLRPSPTAPRPRPRRP
jgi:hypothetical protein